MNTLECLFVRCCDRHASTAIGGFVLVLDPIFQTPERFDSSRLFSVNKHGDVEITFLEHLRNVAQVGLNRATIRGI
jgi:hypothetical protein